MSDLPPRDEAQPTGPLPEPVRQRVVAIASETLGALPADEVPVSLRPFVRFAPAKRVRLAATPIAAALQTVEQFREAVAQRVRNGAPDLAAALAGGEAPPAAEPYDVAAAAYLLQSPGWEGYVAAASEAAGRAEQAAVAGRADEALTRLESELSATRERARADVERLRGELEAAKAEVADLRKKLHEARERMRSAEQTAEAAAAEAAAARAEASAGAASSEAEARRTRARLSEAEAALDAAKRAAREGRSLVDIRLRLLLDTLVEAASGLRRELALPPVGVRPADTVAAVRPELGSAADLGTRAQSEEDPGLLDDLLALPQAHLIVDGYNVTKTGYGSLPLETQRARLLAGLSGLAARTGAEVTCVFDGGALDAKTVGPTIRGVRVLFSPADTIADEVIRRLVRAEPPGRVVVVVSSDREVAEGVRAAGARPVAAAALLRRLDRS